MATLCGIEKSVKDMLTGRRTANNWGITTGHALERILCVCAYDWETGCVTEELKVDAAADDEDVLPANPSPVSFDP